MSKCHNRWAPWGLNPRLARLTSTVLVATFPVSSLWVIDLDAMLARLAVRLQTSVCPYQLLDLASMAFFAAKAILS